MLLMLFISFVPFLHPTSATNYTAALRRKVVENSSLEIPPQLSVLLGDNTSAANRLVAADSLLEEIFYLAIEKNVNNWIPVAISAINNLCQEGFFTDSTNICNKCRSARKLHQRRIESYELTRIALSSFDLEHLLSLACYSLTYSTACNSLLEKSGFRYHLSPEKAADLVSLLQVFTRHGQQITHNGQEWISSNLRLEKLLRLLRRAAPLLMKAFDTQDVKSAEFRAIMVNTGYTDDFLIENFLNLIEFPLEFITRLLPVGMENLRNMLSSVQYTDPESGASYSYLHIFSGVSIVSFFLLLPSTCAVLLEEPSMVNSDFIPFHECIVSWLNNMPLRGVKKISEIPVQWIIDHESLFLQQIISISRLAHNIPFNLRPIANFSSQMSRHIFGSQSGTHCHLLNATDLLMLKNTASLFHISASCFAQIRNIDTVDISELMGSSNGEILAMYNGTFHPKTTNSLTARHLCHLASSLAQDQEICQHSSFVKHINPSAFHSLPAKCLLDYTKKNDKWDFGKNTAYVFEPDMMKLLNMTKKEDIFRHLSSDQLSYLPWDIVSEIYQVTFTHQVVNTICEFFKGLPDTSSLLEIPEMVRRIGDMAQFIAIDYGKARSDIQPIQKSIPEWLSHHIITSVTSWDKLIYAQNMSMLKFVLDIPQMVDIQMPDVFAYLHKCGITLKLFTGLIQASLLDEICTIFIRRRPQFTDPEISFLSFAAGNGSRGAFEYLYSIVRPHIGKNLKDIITNATIHSHHIYLWMLFAPNLESLLQVIRLPPISLSNDVIKVFRDSNERYDMIKSYKFICEYPLTVLCPKSVIATDGSADAGAVRINWIDQVIQRTLLDSNYGLKRLHSNPMHYKFPFLSSPSYGTFASVVILKAKQLNMSIPFTLDPTFFEIMANLETMEYQVENYFEEIYNRELTELVNILKVDSSCLDVVPFEDIVLRTPIKSYPYMPIVVSSFSPLTTLESLKTNPSEYFDYIRNLALKNFKELIWNFRHYFGKIYAVWYLSFIQDFSCFESYFMPNIAVSASTVLERFHYSDSTNEPTVTSSRGNVKVSPKFVFTKFISLLKPEELKAFVAAMTGSKLIDLRQVNFYLQMYWDLPRYLIEYAFTRKSFLSKNEFLEIMDTKFPAFKIHDLSVLPELIDENILSKILKNFSLNDFEIEKVLELVFQPTITLERFNEIMMNLAIALAEYGIEVDMKEGLIDNMQREVFHAASIVACYKDLRVYPQPMRSLILSLVQQINSDPATMDDGFARLPYHE